MHISDIIWTNEDINVRIWSDEELHMFYEHVSDDYFYASHVCINEHPWIVED
jgi:hypothetical protein